MLGGVLEIVADLLGDRMAKSIEEAEERRRQFEEEKRKLEEAEREKRSKAAADADAERARSVADSDIKQSIDNEKAKIEEDTKGEAERRAGEADSGRATGVDDDTVRSSIEEARASVEEDTKGEAERRAGEADSGRATGVDDDTVRSSIEEARASVEEDTKGEAERRAGEADSGRIESVTDDIIRSVINELNAIIEDDAKTRAQNAVSEPPTRVVDPNAVKASLDEATARATEEAKAKAQNAVSEPPTRAVASDMVTRAIDSKVSFDTERLNEKVLDPVNALDINKVDPNPVTSVSTIKQMAEGVPNKDPNGYPNMRDANHLDDSHLGSDSPYGTRLRTTVVAAFSHAFGDDFMSMPAGKDMMVQFASDQFEASRDSTTKVIKPVYNDDAGDQPERSKLRQAVDSVLESAPVRITAEILGKIGDMMDVLGIMMLFTDAFYMREEFMTYGQDTSGGYQPKLLTAGAVQDVISKSVDAQVRSIEEYNCMLYKINNGPTKPYQAYTYATYPQISGPLDYLDRDKPLKTAYDTQARVLTEINAVREALLRNVNTVHGALMRDRLGQSSYDSIKTSGRNKLWMYVGGTFGQFLPREADALYRDAFTHVCKYNGGIVYEDTHAGQDISKAIDPNMYGRARFQCGWATQAECVKRSNVWIENNGKTGGNYAEWFTWDDLKGFQEKTPVTRKCTDPYGQVNDGEYDYSKPKVSKIPSQNLDKLKQSNPLGACVVASSGIRQMCQRARGRYDPVSHKCTFTPQFCQAIGTCYNKATMTCYLPTTAIKSLSIFFGDSLPREYIRTHGCNYTNGTNPAEMIEIEDSNGQNWKTDLAAKNVNLNENFRNLLSSPAYAAGFATSVVGTGQFAIGMTTAGQGALQTEVLAIGSRSLSFGGLLTAVQLLAIGACILAEFMKGWETINKQPSDEIGEYTVGGWDSTGKPKTLGFTPGWVTKPLPLHDPSDRTLVPRADLDSSFGIIPGLFSCRFFADQSALAAAGGVAGNRQLLSGDSLRTAVNTYTSSNSAKDAVPKVQCHSACGTSQGSMRVQGTAVKGILAASNPDADKIWCLAPFPGDAYFDPAIGPAAPIPDPGSYTNNTWTNGQQYTWPQYPFGPAGNYVEGAWHTPGDQNKNIKQWNYQLVYDKVRFGNAHTNPDGMPSHIWNTTLLRKYFRDSKISEMRRYYCQAALNKYIKNKTVPIDNRCFGYLSIDLDKYTFLPMTVLARVGRFTPAV